MNRRSPLTNALEEVRATETNMDLEASEDFSLTALW